MLFFVGGPKADTRKVTAEKKSILKKLSSEVTTTFKTDLLKTRGKKVYQPEPKNLELKKHRTNIREVMLWSNATPIRRYGGMGYMCCYCNNHYLEPTDLKIHTLETHQEVKKASFMVKVSMDQFIIRLDITSLQCSICNKDLDTLEHFMDHLKSEHQKPIYTDIKNHIIPFKFDTEILRCCICMNTFSKFKMLLEHMSVHYRNYICDICDTGFITSQGLKCHKRIHETGTFKCDHCSLVFDTNVKRNAHVRTMHSSKPVAKCMYCNEVFKDYRKKEAHLVTMHGLKVPTPKCQACEKVFKNRKVLNIHIKRDHLLDRRHKCPQCGMGFFASKELKDHMIKHTGLRSFTCSICSKTFSRAKTLKVHLKIHDGVRKFKCEHCGQAFVQKCSWRIHMRSKHGEIV